MLLCAREQNCYKIHNKILSYNSCALHIEENVLINDMRKRGEWFCELFRTNQSICWRIIQVHDSCEFSWKWPYVHIDGHGFVAFEPDDIKLKRKKEIWLGPMAKGPYNLRKLQKANWQHKNATKNFDNTTIADRLATVSWSNNSHSTGVINRV